MVGVVEQPSPPGRELRFPSELVDSFFLPRAHLSYLAGCSRSAIQICAVREPQLSTTHIVQTHRTLDCSQMLNFTNSRYETSLDATWGHWLVPSMIVMAVSACASDHGQLEFVP